MISAQIIKCMKLNEFLVPENKSARHARGKAGRKAVD
jgi:hypothetical protein